MHRQRNNLSWILSISLAIALSTFFAETVLSQNFVTPELPLSKTVDGQIYGAPRGQTVEGDALQGRIIEGRILTGQNGQPGDRTLRFPDTTTSPSSDDADLIFGPIDIEPLPEITPQRITGPPQGTNQQNTARPQSKVKRKPDLRELPNREIIRQRYPDGNVQIARHVMQDGEGNWVNDGQWKLFDQQGAMIASGNYRNGTMDGKWSRLHTSGSGGIFSNVPFLEFDGPYASHASFERGKLSGRWVIQDRQGQKILEIPYKNGKRNGVAVWYLPQGKIYRRMEFADDVPVGNLVEYDNRGKIRRKETYKDGMKIVNNVTYYRPSGQKRQESIVRRGRLELQGGDDWWEAKPAQMVVTGEDVQHGPVRSWFENGQTKMIGNLVQGTRVGGFTWWHRNGTKQLIGQYDKSGSKTGRWRWWHENGVKSIDGSYADGEADGEWQWWNEDGELVNEEDFDASQTQTDTSSDLSQDDDETERNLDDAFGEDPDESSIFDDGNETDENESDGNEVDNNEAADNDEGTSVNDLFSDELEDIQPESIDAEEIPEPETAGQTPAVLREGDLDPEVEAFFQIQDDQ